VALDFVADYVIGFLVKDLDGNATEADAQINVP
jgi:hypothetical protein